MTTLPLVPASGSAAGWAKTTSGKWYTKDLLPFEYQDADATGGGGIDPAQQYFIHILVMYPQATVDAPFNAYMTLEYDTIWKEPKLLPSS